MKGLHLILSAHLHLKAVAVNPHNAVKRALHTSEIDNWYASKTKQIHQRDSRNISGQINILLHSENALEIHGGQQSSPW